MDSPTNPEEEVKKPNTSINPQKSSMEILSELFSTFDAKPPIIVKKEKDSSKKHKKSKKKHKHKSKKDKKHKKKSKKRHRSCSSSSSKSSLDLAEILLKSEKDCLEQFQKRIKLEDVGEDIQPALSNDVEPALNEDIKPSLDELERLNAQHSNELGDDSNENGSLNELGNSVDNCINKFEQDVEPTSDRILKNEAVINEEDADLENELTASNVRNKIQIKNLKFSEFFQSTLKEIEEKQKQSDKEEGIITSDSEDYVECEKKKHKKKRKRSKHSEDRGRSRHTKTHDGKSSPSNSKKRERSRSSRPRHSRSRSHERRYKDKYKEYKDKDFKDKEYKEKEYRDKDYKERDYKDKDYKERDKYKDDYRYKDWDNYKYKESYRKDTEDKGWRSKESSYRTERYDFIFNNFSTDSHFNLINVF